jgi:hypothetical protein
MTPAPTPAESSPSTWRRITAWLNRWDEALDFDISEHHERRIGQLEREVAALRADRTNSSGTVSADREIGKEVP